MYRHFAVSEFRCPCCSQNYISERLVQMADDARELAGFPWKINSGYRCPKHNQKVGGVEGSSHTKGFAFDVHCSGSTQRYAIVKALIAAGFKRIGIGETFVHADIDDDKPQRVMWTYG